MDSIEEKVKDIIKAQLGSFDSVVNSETTFSDLGADSLDTAEIVLDVEQTFGTVISDGNIEKIETVGDMMAQVKKQLKA